MKDPTDYISAHEMPYWWWEHEEELGYKIKVLLNRFVEPDITEFPFIGEQLYAEEEGWA